MRRAISTASRASPAAERTWTLGSSPALSASALAVGGAKRVDWSRPRAVAAWAVGSARTAPRRSTSAFCRAACRGRSPPRGLRPRSRAGGAGLEPRRTWPRPETGSSIPQSTTAPSCAAGRACEAAANRLWPIEEACLLQSRLVPSPEAGQEAQALRVRCGRVRSLRALRAGALPRPGLRSSGALRGRSRRCGPRREGTRECRRGRSLRVSRRAAGPGATFSGGARPALGAAGSGCATRQASSWASSKSMAMWPVSVKIDRLSQVPRRRFGTTTATRRSGSLARRLLNGLLERLRRGGQDFGGCHSLAAGPVLAYSLDRVRRMSKVEVLIEEARQLPASDRRRLIEEVERSFKSDRGAEAPLSPSYAPLLSLAGTAASDFSDVSVDKYDHVAEASASRPAED